MRRWTAPFALAVGLCLIGVTAGAEGTQEAAGIEEQMRRMNERMAQLENKLEATQDELSATQDELSASQDEVERQSDVMEKAGLESREGKSGLDSFFSMVEVDGNVTVGWNYNFGNPSDSNAGANTGAAGLLYPFHPDHNSFELNQLWLGIEKPVSEESRAGFRVDMIYGKTASILGALTSGINRAPSVVGGGIQASSDSASDFNLWQAYVQYLTPWGPTVRAGKFATIIGMETPRATDNLNISRGNVYNILQPFAHYGIIVDGEAGPLSYTIGGVNRARCCGNDPDTNDAKSLLAGVTFGGETFSLATKVAWGAEAIGNSVGDSGLLNFMATFDPTDRFSSYIDFVYRWEPGQGVNNAPLPAGVSPDPDGWGVAAAGRFGITEAIGFALRFEYLQDSSNQFGFADSFGTPIDVDLWGITGTFDWEITEGLIAKAELRYDRIENEGGPGGNSKQFISSRNLASNGPGGANTGIAGGGQFTKSDQLVGLLELTYQF